MNLRLRRVLVMTVGVVAAWWGMLGREAHGHFLFVRIEPAAEAGRAAEVYFSEQAEAGDPRFVAKVAGTKLWAQTAPGKFEPLVVRKGADRLRAPLAAAGSVAVVGLCDYGVLARPGQTPFLLRYYPKAIDGRPDELNRMVRREEVPLEIMATVDGKHVKLSVLRQGKPVPGAKLTTVDADLTNTELKAGSDGVATWTPPAPGRYSVYTRETIPEKGQAGGVAYDEVREFATLAFAWPLDRHEADTEAVALFEDALAHRAQWKDFPGFRAELSGEVDGRPFSGKARFLADGSVEVEADDPVALPWVRDQFESLAMHRVAESSSGSGPRDRPVLRFTDDREDHPLGRLLVFEGGRFASSYRVKDHQLTVVNRRIGPRNMTITVLDNDRNPEGRFLPRSYLVHYWDARTGALDRVETVQERWQRIGSWDLPVTHTLTTASGGGLSVRSVTLSGHALLEAK